MVEIQTNRLDSWKEIAQYLGRDVSTVIRWEKDKELPVHRVPGGKRHAVFAYREEIDAWLAGQQPNGLAEAAPRTLAEPRESAKSGGAQRGWWARTAGWVAGAVVLLGVLAVVLVLVIRGNRPGLPERVTFAGNKLVAWDALGRVAWVHEFPWMLEDAPPGRLADYLRIADIAGDSQPEVLVAPFFQHTGANEYKQEGLFCFSAQGKLLWNYKPDMLLRFGEHEYDGPWIFTTMLVTGEQKEKMLWAAFAHDPWWPSFVVQLDASGHGTVRYVSSGHVYVLAQFRTGAGSYILAGGVNNEYNAGMLAVLPENLTFASSPQTPGSLYECKSCESGQPLRYFVFPRSEINRVAGAAYNEARSLTPFDSRMEIRTLEVLPSKDFIIQGIYNLSSRLEIETATRSDAYWDRHRQLEAEGKIKHSVEQCPERTKPLTVRAWTPEKGWLDVSANATPSRK